MTFWTEERKAELTRMRADGQSGGMMALVLGISRGAVNAACIRFGLPRPVRSTRINAAKNPRRRKSQTGNPSYPREYHDQIIDLPSEQSENPVKIFDLEWYHCRWPIDGEGVNTLFCGDYIHAEHSYCLRHFKIGTLRSISKAAEARKEYGRDWYAQFKTASNAA